MEIEIQAILSEDLLADQNSKGFCLEVLDEANNHFWIVIIFGQRDTIKVLLKNSVSILYLGCITDRQFHAWSALYVCRKTETIVVIRTSG